MLKGISPSLFCLGNALFCHTIRGMHLPFLTEPLSHNRSVWWKQNRSVLLSKELQIPEGLSAEAPAHRGLLPFPSSSRGKTRPAVLSLALEEAEEDGAHQVGCWWGSPIRKGLGAPTFFISLPTVSGHWPGSGHRATWAATTARHSCRPPGRLGLTEAGVFPELFPGLSSFSH